MSKSNHSFICAQEYTDSSMLSWFARNVEQLTIDNYFSWLKEDRSLQAKLKYALGEKEMPQGVSPFELEILTSEARFDANGNITENYLHAYLAWFALRVFADWAGSRDGYDRMIMVLMQNALATDLSTVARCGRFFEWLNMKVDIKHKINSIGEVVCVAYALNQALKNLDNVLRLGPQGVDDWSDYGKLLEDLADMITTHINHEGNLVRQLEAFLRFASGQSI
jgi:hypothetical protein